MCSSSLYFACPIRFARWQARFEGVGKYKYADKTNAHALHGRFCLLDPGGYLLSRVHSSQSSRCCAIACIARCSLGLRLASSPTGRARLRPLQVKRFAKVSNPVSWFPRKLAQARKNSYPSEFNKQTRPCIA